MEGNAYLTSILAGAFYVIASVRLLRLNRRTHERPELLLGIYFALSGLYYIGYNAPSLLGFDSWPMAMEWAIEWTYVIGVLPYLFFIRMVFHQNEAWAGALVAICSAILLFATMMGNLTGRVALSLDNPWFLLQWVGYTTPCVWMCVAALHQWKSAHKRSRIGLCPPIVANRYLLLALFGLFQSFACLADLSLASEVGGNQAISVVSDLLLGSAEIASVAVLWLAFMPPQFFEDWINRRVEILPTPAEG